MKAAPQCPQEKSVLMTLIAAIFLGFIILAEAGPLGAQEAAEDTTLVRVIVNNLNVRETPSVSGGKLGELAIDTEVNFINREGEWFEIAFGDSTGFIHSRFAVPIQDALRADRLATLDQILISIEQLIIQRRELERTHRLAATPAQKEKIAEDIAAVNDNLDRLEAEFTLVATGVDPVLFHEKVSEDVDIQRELLQIFTPIVTELKQTTSYPREMARLNSEIAFYESRLPQIEEALLVIAELQAHAQSARAKQRLDEQTEFWLQLQQQYQGEYEAVQIQLAEREKEKKSVAQVAKDVFQVFFKSRGQNFILAVFAFIGVFLLLRFFHRLLHKFSPVHRSGRHQFVLRLLDVFYYVFTVVTAISALLIVLYFSSDWVLLGLAILMIAGLAWTARHTLPMFLEQAKLLLNLGAVREGERVMYNDIPWKVDALNIYTDLVNPDLKGGRVRLPLRDLIGMRSRPFEEDEPWFPTNEGDWVILSDNFYGKIHSQTPEFVVLDTLRGSLKAYPTAEFLSQYPRNLTRNLFSVKGILGVDYKHRHIAQSEIAPKVKAMLEETIKKQFYGDCLVQTIVEVQQLADSSINIITIAKFSGGAASEYTEIGWLLQQVALEACNQNGWEIPFPQRTLHMVNAPRNGVTKDSVIA